MQTQNKKEKDYQEAKFIEAKLESELEPELESDFELKLKSDTE